MNFLRYLGTLRNSFLIIINIHKMANKKEIILSSPSGGLSRLVAYREGREPYEGWPLRNVLNLSSVPEDWRFLRIARIKHKMKWKRED